ncbi:MAG: hypothetical protein QNJ27_00200 [Simkaniaceae bacterium]|nr:hypothetical protein [Simkaniaceae bacterium]
MTVAIDKRKLMDLALEAGRRYLSPQTNLIHYCYEDERSTDTIPIFENLCYCLTLFRTKMQDHVREGKERLKHLLAFRDEKGRFPIYLHQYPKGMGSYRTMYPLFLIDKHFHKVIEKPLRSELRKNLRLPLPPTAVTNSKEAGLVALDLVCHDSPLDALFPLWDFENELYSGPLGDERQRKGEIETTLFDLFMGHSPRILKPHPVHLHAALVFSAGNHRPVSPIACSCPRGVGTGYHLYRKLWKEGNHLHTLVCQDKNMLCTKNTFTYPERIPDEKNRMELTFYTDRAEKKTVLINGEKGTVFRLGDVISISTPVKTVKFTFKLTEGEGDFLGHLSFGNRPAQIETDDLTAYDWKIGIRSLRRTATLCLQLQEL